MTKLEYELIYQCSKVMDWLNNSFFYIWDYGTLIALCRKEKIWSHSQDSRDVLTCKTRPMQLLDTDFSYMLPARELICEVRYAYNTISTASFTKRIGLLYKPQRANRYIWITQVHKNVLRACEEPDLVERFESKKSHNIHRVGERVSHWGVHYEIRDV